MSSPALNRPVASFAIRMHFWVLTRPTLHAGNFFSGHFLPLCTLLHRHWLCYGFLLHWVHSCLRAFVCAVPSTCSFSHQSSLQRRPFLSITFIRTPCFIFFKAFFTTWNHCAHLVFNWLCMSPLNVCSMLVTQSSTPNNCVWGNELCFQVGYYAWDILPWEVDEGMKP